MLKTTHTNTHTLTQVNYEAYITGGYGARLSQTFTSQGEALKCIKESKKQQEEAGYKPDNYYIVLCVHTVARDSNGDIISENTTRTRI